MVRCASNPVITTTGTTTASTRKSISPSSLRRLSTYLRLKQQPISDYDILVEFSSLNPIPLSRFLQVKENLENVLRSDIDLVTKSGLGNKSFKQRVLNNMEVIYDDQKNIWRLNHMA